MKKRYKQLKSKLERELEGVRAELERLGQIEPDSEYGPGEGDPTIYEWEMSLAMRKRLEAKAQSLESALEKMKEGTYGICERCGETIDPERLEVLPETTLCITCAQGGG
ncbi:MAG: TraR/DksA family transcriptional regulator [Anaerolineae bacterium]